MASTHISLPCIKVTQPIGTFYVGTIGAADLVAISYADIRRMERREVELVLGIQRPLSPERVAELREYVRTVDASFPTSVIVTIDSENAEYDEEHGLMRIRREERVAKIIDGQHRIAGLEGYSGPPFQLNVAIFVDMDLEDQALLFATINLKQTKVSKSLAYDLFEFASTRSPQKTCHDIVKLLNSKEESPFKDRIKILGVATGKPEETLTQAAFVDRLIVYISSSPMTDRDLLRRGKRLKRAEGSEERKLIFRNMFIDERDAEIARVLWNFFSAAANRWQEGWRKQPGNILLRTTGFGALMRFLRVAYINLARPGRVAPISAFEPIFARMRLKDGDFTPNNFPPGTSGESALFQEFLSQSRLTEE